MEARKMKMRELLNKINETTTVEELVSVIKEASEAIDDDFTLDLFLSEAWRRFSLMRR